MLSKLFSEWYSEHGRGDPDNMEYQEDAWNAGRQACKAEALELLKADISRKGGEIMAYEKAVEMIEDLMAEYKEELDVPYDDQTAFGLLGYAGLKGYTIPRKGLP